MRKPESIAKSIYSIAPDFDLISSRLELAGLEMELVQKTARETIWERGLKCLPEKYDYILIDCPPQFNGG